MRSVFLAKNDKTKVIKCEVVDDRTPKDFCNEVFIQRKAAK